MAICNWHGYVLPLRRTADGLFVADWRCLYDLLARDLAYESGSGGI